MYVFAVRDPLFVRPAESNPPGPWMIDGEGVEGTKDKTTQ